MLLFTATPKPPAPLLSKGADVNAKDQYKKTPLHLAACYGHTETARVFVEQGANVNAKDSKGNKPFDLVHANRNGEELRVLLLQ